MKILIPIFTYFITALLIWLSKDMIIHFWLSHHEVWIDQNFTGWYIFILLVNLISAIRIVIWKFDDTTFILISFNIVINSIINMFFLLLGCYGAVLILIIFFYIITITYKIIEGNPIYLTEMVERNLNTFQEKKEEIIRYKNIIKQFK